MKNLTGSLFPDCRILCVRWAYADQHTHSAIWIDTRDDKLLVDALYWYSFDFGKHKYVCST